MMSGQFTERPAWQCQKCKAVILTLSGMERHAEKCKYCEPEMEWQVSLFEQCSQQNAPHTLCGDRPEV